MVNNAELASQLRGMEVCLNNMQSGIQSDMADLRKEVSRISAFQPVLVAERILSLEGSVNELKGGMQEILRRLNELGQPPGPPKLPDPPRDPSSSGEGREWSVAPPDYKPAVVATRQTQRNHAQHLDNFPENNMPVMWPRKLELPIFKGENPDRWIFRAERYFQINHIFGIERVRGSVVCLKGDALAWFQWEEGRRAFRSWEDLKNSLILRFRSGQEGTLHEQLLALRQTTTVREYRRQFEIFASPLKGTSEEMLEAAFVNGLRVEIRAELRQWAPYGLENKMQLAQRIEDKLITLGHYPPSLAR